MSLLNKYKYLLLFVALIIVIVLWQPHALIYGIQRGSMYSIIALPLALVLGILGVLNLAHGEFLTVGMYLSYFLFSSFKLDPLVSIIPVTIILLVLGAVVYLLTVKHVLKDGHLNQLLITFGISLILVEFVNIIWTSRPRNVFTMYSYSSMQIGEFRFGTYEFIYLLIAVAILVLLQLFLKKTRLGQATFAVGQNPRGAKIVGINVGLVYLFVFSIAVAILGIAGGAMLPRTSIFPTIGSPYSMKSFALAAMAGLGNLTGILVAGLSLGVVEAVVMAIPGYEGWADIVFFSVLIAVILIRSYREAR